MKNSDLFIAAFNEIEHFFRRSIDSENYLPFSGQVTVLSSGNRIVKQKSFELRLFADLRNAIVHTRRANSTIAEPNNETVQEIQHIRDLLINPPQVLPLFQDKVLSLSPDDDLKTALKDLFLNSYSQCPVVRNGVLVGMITNNSIARWLGAQADEEGVCSINFNNVTVRQVLNHQEEKEGFHVISRTTNLAEVLEFFQKADEKGDFLQALFITKSGKAHDPLLGIITRSDLPKIVSELNL